MRFAVDTGGTFTDLVVEDGSGITVHKAPTTPDDPIRGVLDVLAVGARARGMDPQELLGAADLLIHGTTRAINAILTGHTARTAFLTTEGHPDILLFREGGRTDPFDFTRPYPDPYVPRSLTFEVPGRVGADGKVVRPLDEEAVLRIADRMQAAGVEAVGVCLLWSTVNPDHENRVAQLLADRLPGVAVSLSHRLNPTIREYRRASATCIDASLKPLMSAYMRDLEQRLRDVGFGGQVLVVTSAGGVQQASAVAEAPIQLINSGPAMAPVAGRRFAQVDTGATTAIVADTGGTTYDVSLVQDGTIPVTRETWIGAPYVGHMTGFPSVDVKSVGAGGGSIAWVDEGGLLRVGPQSAGAVPGPACYGRGGDRPTVTDACAVLGYFDPAFFLGGTLGLDLDAARAAVERHVAQPLGIDVAAAASAVLDLATENMVRAIEEITIDRGVDPTEAVLVAGGGAAGLNAVAIARRLGCRTIVIPATGAVLSAAGALLSELVDDYSATLLTSTAGFDHDAVNTTLADLWQQARAFLDRVAGGDGAVTFAAEARYPHQIWELLGPLRSGRFGSAADVAALETDFHRTHQQVFGICDADSVVEVVGVRARAQSVGLASDLHAAAAADGGRPMPAAQVTRRVCVDGGWAEVPVLAFDDLMPGRHVAGPVLVESPVTTVVVDGGAVLTRQPSGSLVIATDLAGERRR
jgi:N-methylhydantoinase A